MTPMTQPDMLTEPRQPPSYWMRQALAVAPAKATPLDGDARADVCIVGGGYTGLWTALRLKELEPALDVVVVERDLCGSGASGRNAGYLMTWASKFTTLQEVCGAQEALRLYRASAEAVDAILGFCETRGIPALMHRAGWIWTATSEAQRGAWMPVLEALAKLGEEPFVELSAEETALRTGSPGHLAGVWERAVATIQPAVLVRGLRDAALEAGVRVCEMTAMTGIETGRPPAVRTERGTVRADKVVLALNAYATALPAFRRSLLAVASDQLLTAADPAAMAKAGLDHGAAISDSRLLVFSLHATPEGRLNFSRGAGDFAFAGRVGAKFHGPALRTPFVRATLDRFYPGLHEVPIEHSWRGPVTRTSDGLPFFGRYGGHPDIAYGHGYSGNGVGPSWLGGRILASMTLGRNDEWSGIVLARGPRGRRFPPEPVRYVGAHMVRAAVERKEAAEDAGRRPTAPDRVLARFAPSGLVPKRAT